MERLIVRNRITWQQEKVEAPGQIGKLSEDIWYATMSNHASIWKM